MAPYIGTPTSRIDGIAKVTGAAKYAAEFNVPGGVLYGSIVPSTIAKGRIISLDTSAAMGVEGVSTVLTHENRPRMAGRDRDYKDDVAPDGSPFRPLYDDKIRFNGQPIALVVAETSEVARFAASLVRVEYESEAHVTDVFRQRDAAIPVKATSPRVPCSRRRSRAATPGRLSPRPRCGTTASIMSRSSTTTRWSSTPQRSSSRKTASSRCTTRPRACRTCSVICAVCSA